MIWNQATQLLSQVVGSYINDNHEIDGDKDLSYCPTIYLNPHSLDVPSAVETVESIRRLSKLEASNIIIALVGLVGFLTTLSRC